MPYARFGLCPIPGLAYALCPVVPHLSEKGYIYLDVKCDRQSAMVIAKIIPFFQNHATLVVGCGAIDSILNRPKS
jgi:hypothetical protein